MLSEWTGNPQRGGEPRRRELELGSLEQHANPERVTVDLTHRPENDDARGFLQAARRCIMERWTRC